MNHSATYKEGFLEEEGHGEFAGRKQEGRYSYREYEWCQKQNQTWNAPWGQDHGHAIQYGSLSIVPAHNRYSINTWLNKQVASFWSITVLGHLAYKIQGHTLGLMGNEFGFIGWAIPDGFWKWMGWKSTYQSMDILEKHYSFREFGKAFKKHAFLAHFFPFFFLNLLFTLIYYLI